MLRIVPSVSSRLAEFRQFWDAAVAWQTARGLPLSPPFPEHLIRPEMADGLHFMGLRRDDLCAGFFSVTLSDRVLWGERDRDDGIYIHRMCVNPLAKGERFAAGVLAWAHGHAAGRGRAFVRLDTWADNDRLVAYYGGCGYRLVGFRDVGDAPTLSAHYHGIRLALFENPVA